MVLLRATQRVLKSLPESAVDGAVSDNALGDWYVNRIVVDRHPLLLFVSAKSLLIMFSFAKAVKTLPDRFPGMVADRLRQMDVDGGLIDSETATMHTVHVGRTRDRSVTAQMVNFAKSVPFCLPSDGWDAIDLRMAESKLGEAPYQLKRGFEGMIFPNETALRLLREKWSPETAGGRIETHSEG